VFIVVTRQNVQLLDMLASTFTRGRGGETSSVHNHNLINPTYGLCSGFRGVKLEKLENADLLIQAEKPIYLLYMISMRRIFVVVQRSKD
jgi:hypothetical protein